MPTAVVLSHDWIAHELGHLEPWLDATGFSVTRLYRENAPALPDADLLIVLGSPNTTVADVCTPATVGEIDAVRTWVSAGRPYLGICFGAQVLATGFGGRVDRMTTPFSGYVDLETTDDAPSALAGPWTVWHNDGITAPSTSEVMGSLDHADLAIRTRRAWGLQPHIEVTAESLERMVIALGATPQEYGPIVDAVRADADANTARAQALLDAFWAEVNKH